MEKVYLLLGGNQGDKKQVFGKATEMLLSRIGEITSLSSIYETEPWGFESSDLFWNQALEISTDLSPEEILEQTKQIETELGRERKTLHYDSRIIDIDILFYGNRIIRTPNLVIPHPRIQERKFVLIPLFEIAPQLNHPVLQKTIGQLLAESTDTLGVERLDNQ